MTFTPASEFTPAQRVAAALFKVVDDSFKEGLDQQGGEWLAANKATAAKVYRFHNSMTWFWADQIIQAENITDPLPNEFMSMFQEAVFTRALEFFPGMAERGSGKMLWAVLLDDTEKTPALIAEVIARKPPYLTHAIFKSWMTAQGVDIDGVPQFAMWMMTSTAAGLVEGRVRAALKVGH